MSHKPPLQAVAQFQLSSLKPGGRKIDITAIVVPKVTCDLPMSPVSFQMDWTHLQELSLADPGFTQPGWIDIYYLEHSRGLFPLQLKDHARPLVEWPPMALTRPLSLACAIKFIF